MLKAVLDRIRRALGLPDIRTTAGDADPQQDAGRDERDILDSEDPDIEDEAEYDPSNPFPEPVVIEFRDVIDLHSIPPKLVKPVVEDYIEEAHCRGVRQVRIIHGKGIGVQREMVRSILARSKFVVEYQDAPAESQYAMPDPTYVRVRTCTCDYVLRVTCYVSLGS